MVGDRLSRFDGLMIYLPWGCLQYRYVSWNCRNSRFLVQCVGWQVGGWHGSRSYWGSSLRNFLIGLLPSNSFTSFAAELSSRCDILSRSYRYSVVSRQRVECRPIDENIIVFFFEFWSNTSRKFLPLVVCRKFSTGGGCVTLTIL